jgi:RNA polymerase sigma-70 factor, ECF subfamily
MPAKHQKPHDLFAALLSQNGGKAYNFAYRLTGNDQDAWDLTQEAFSKAYDHINEYDAARPFEAWLLRILHNLFLDQMRRADHRRVQSLDAPPPGDDGQGEERMASSEPDPMDRLMKEETDHWVQQALLQLPPPYRSAVILCDMEGFTYERISEILGCPVGTVRSRLHQGRLLMKTVFEKLTGKKGIAYDPA